MISLKDLTTGNAIRSVLGADHTELSDTTIFDSELEVELELEFERAEEDGWLPDSIANIVTDGTDPNPTQLELKTYRLCRLYAKYFCALKLLPSLRVGLPYENSDGSSVMRRSQNIDFDALKEEITGELDKLKDELQEITEPTVSTTAGSWAVGAAEPAYDPVTNEST